MFEKSSATHPDIVHAKVDTEAEQQLAAMANIRSIPTIMAFRESVLVYSRPGYCPHAPSTTLIGRVKALDMALVHATVAERRAVAGA
ncbi:putative thioredoxin 2 [Rhodococcus sp. T7]|uniref:Putative thioredoxin n=2 Tax=Rhodococcus opacus TaxID=37919 RepID=C1BD93_RHOOB|nr:putative thioredoxin [Rhodococcus opacus RKJ300 = JCM 13270]KAF0957510.1 putative thioredoxin 2 [Rhodococcus sp. T7]KAF0965080.1 putative thioredoxin 2 [Rhodococcus sp. T7]BAH55837.1 putative thioredoxin [Rhodococcus opacus B4]